MGEARVRYSQQSILCDVELSISGPSDVTLTNSIVTALRAIADRLERNEYRDGEHQIFDTTGRSIGMVYIGLPQALTEDTV